MTTRVLLAESRGVVPVSRYFRYKNRQSLMDRRPGAGAGAPPGRRPLAAPRGRWSIDGTTVGNRLAIQPMEGCDGNLDGTPSELTLRRYRRFGAGGAKLIWGEACAVTPEGRANPRQLLIEESTARGLEQLSEHLPAGPRRVARIRRRPARRPATDPLGPVLLPAADPGAARPAARSQDDRRSLPGEWPRVLRNR